MPLYTYNKPSVGSELMAGFGQGILGYQQFKQQYLQQQKENALRQAMFDWQQQNASQENYISLLRALNAQKQNQGLTAANKITLARLLAEQGNLPMASRIAAETYMSEPDMFAGSPIGGSLGRELSAADFEMKGKKEKTKSNMANVVNPKTGDTKAVDITDGIPEGYILAGDYSLNPQSGKTEYSTIQQIGDALWSSRGGMFSQVVLIEYPKKGMWAIAFLTNENKGSFEINERTGEELLSIFMPTTPNPTSGFLLFIPRKDCIFLKISVADGMRLVISGGAVPPGAIPPGTIENAPESKDKQINC